jgi:hypothetical protein
MSGMWMGEQILKNRLLIKEETRMDVRYAFRRDIR